MLDHGGEGRGFEDGEPHPQADADQQDRAGKRQAPAPVEEFAIVEPQPERQEQAIGGDETDRRTQLREHAITAAPAGRGVLHRQQRRAAPFAAQAKALAEAEQAQDCRRGDADGGIGGQEGDGEGGAAHQQQRSDERGFAAQPVAIMAEHQRTDWSGDEGDGEAGEAEQQLQIGIVGREEQRPEHQRRGGGVDVEIIEFHRRADEAGGEDAAGGGWAYSHGAFASSASIAAGWLRWETMAHSSPFTITSGTSGREL